jgi:hypothetical protein
MTVLRYVPRFTAERVPRASAVVPETFSRAGRPLSAALILDLTLLKTAQSEVIGKYHRDKLPRQSQGRR